MSNSIRISENCAAQVCNLISLAKESIERDERLVKHISLFANQQANNEVKSAIALQDNLFNANVDKLHSCIMIVQKAVINLRVLRDIDADSKKMIDKAYEERIKELKEFAQKIMPYTKHHQLFTDTETFIEALQKGYYEFKQALEESAKYHFPLKETVV
jgi:hypothetical protein